MLDYKKLRKEFKEVLSKIGEAEIDKWLNMDAERLEEHKQETFVNGKCFKCGRNRYSSRKPFCTDDFCNKDFYQKPEQETFEDAAKDFVENTMKFSFTSIDTRTQANRMLKCVEFGAKWQQEENKNMYSEEEVHTIIESYQNTVENNPVYITYTEWFEQFKKK